MKKEKFSLVIRKKSSQSTVTDQPKTKSIAAKQQHLIAHKIQSMGKIDQLTTTKTTRQTQNNKPL